MKITTAVQQHFHTGEEQLQQKLLEAGIRLERRSEEFFSAGCNSAWRRARTLRGEMPQVHAKSRQKAADMHAEIKQLSDAWHA